MITFLEDLRLRLFLRATAVWLRRARERSARMRGHMATGDFVMQIRTEGGTGGFFEVRNGTIRLGRGLHPSPDFSQIWRCSRDAFRALTSRDETELFRAVEDGRLRLRGQFQVALWFNEAVRIARS